MSLIFSGRGARCYLCRNEGFDLITDRLRSGVKRKVFRCGECGLVFLEPRAALSREYYESGQYRGQHGPVVGHRLSSRETFEMYWPHQRRRVEELEPILRPEMRVLEVGSSAGYLLFALKGRVEECVGIEPNRDDAEFATKELGIATYTRPIEETDLPFQHFDLIAVPQVLSVLEDPLGFLVTISRYLKPSGYLWIEVPNVEGALLSVYRNRGYRDFYFSEPYLFYFSVKSLNMLVDRAGFHGAVKTVQSYTFLNHVHWLLTGQPQPSVRDGMSLPEISTGESATSTVTRELTDWFRKVDAEYRGFLGKHDLGDTLSFIGEWHVPSSR